MIIRLARQIQKIKKFETRKKREINKSEKTLLDRMYNKIDSYNNVMNNLKSRIEKLLYLYQEE